MVHCPQYQFTNLGFYHASSIKFKKFEEILFLLTADLKGIKEFLISVNFNIHIDVYELIDLILILMIIWVISLKLILLFLLYFF